MHEQSYQQTEVKRPQSQKSNASCCKHQEANHVCYKAAHVTQTMVPALAWSRQGGGTGCCHHLEPK